MNSEHEPEYDDVFGELNYDTPTQEWCASVALAPFHEVDVAIWWDEKQDGPFSPVLKRARAAFQRFLRDEHRHKELLAGAMLERYRTRANADQTVPDISDIVRGLRARQISIASDGSMSVDYGGGEELFGDHSVLSDIAADGSFTGFSLQG